MGLVVSRPADAGRAFADAWNRDDMDDFSSLFCEDANFVNVVGMWWKNRREIEAAHRATHETMFRDSRLKGVLALCRAVSQLGRIFRRPMRLWQPFRTKSRFLYHARCQCRG